MQITRRHLSLAAGMATAVALSAGALIASTAQAAPVTGSAAPAFSGVTSEGETISLADFAGKTVVLEWTNDGCPFVKKHYTAPPSNMQELQKSAAADDIVWISVISSAEGEQGYADAARANQLTASRGAAPAHVLLDAEGTIGKLYGAKTTPHMFIIAPEGDLVYDGAIDSKATAKVADIGAATNYVTAALADLEAGKPVATPVTKPYGCAVKYK
ncbi:redoxin domain-containing protein [Hyphomonas sp.]|jgi:peroxiredoxin|uniref:redoxin domain-containing protein n=1 Tax=Hyphomonas sp. TaxID=87 RepID=UPI0025C686E1|nr:redoxin domain-containing protein [Hyphomonas sp.]